MGEQAAPRIEILRLAADDPAMALIVVRDNGLGIAEDHQERIFTPFNQLDAGSEGVGLGLALVRRMVENQGGTIRVESSGRAGEGSVFYVELPLAQGR